MKFVQPRVALAALVPMLLTLCASGPPPEGVELQLYGGTGMFDYETGAGCAGPSYVNRAVEGHGFASASYRSKGGASAVVEVSGGAAKTTSSRLTWEGWDEEPPPPTDTNELGKTRPMINVATRIGYHHEFFGIEAGPAYHNDVGFTGSAELWGGWPHYAYFYVDVLSGPVARGHRPYGAGVGHISDRVRAKVGIGFLTKVVGEASFKVSKDVPLFIGGRLVQQLDPNLAGTLGGLTFAYSW